MKRIEAVVRREKLSDVKHALATVPHCELTARVLKEEDRLGGDVLLYRSVQCVLDMVPRAEVSVLVDDVDAQAAVDAIAAAASTGREGDGVIVVASVDHVVPISSAVTRA